MLKYIEKFERLVVNSLMVMMALIVVFAAVELAWMMIKDIVAPPFDLLRISELLEIFGLFLLVLIGLELLGTIKTYVMRSVIHVEVVLTVALIAIARKVIILDVKKTSAFTLMGIGVILISLSVGYYLLRRRRQEEERQK